MENNPEKNGDGSALPSPDVKQQLQASSPGAQINFGNVLEHDLEDMDGIALAMSAAEAAPLDASKTIWSAAEVGESKMLMFLGYEVLDVEYDGKRARLPYVIFAESYMPKGAKAPMIRLILVGRSKVTHFFLDIERESKAVRGAKQPIQSLWQISYNGLRSSKNKNIHDYSISPAQIRRV